MTDHDAHPAPADDDDAPPTADEALALIREQQRTVAERQLGSIPWMLAMWGIAWTIGFFALWSAYDGGNPWFRLPLGLAAAIFGGLIIGAIVTSAVIGTGIGRGVRGASAFSGAVYGTSWVAGSLATLAIGIALDRAGASGVILSLYYPAAYALVAGLMYLTGAALWRSIDQLVIGAVIITAGAIAPFFGAPTNNLVMAVVGGGSFLIAAAVMHLGLKRGRR